MLNDDIVDEVRNIREAHAAKFNFDLLAIVEDLKKSEAKRIEAGHPYVLPPVMPPKPDSAFQQSRFPRR